MDLPIYNVMRIRSMYNVMVEKMATDYWSKLEKLYVNKSLSNKLHLKKKL